MPIESKNMIHKIMSLNLFKNHIRLVFRPTQILPNKTETELGSLYQADVISRNFPDHVSSTRSLNQEGRSLYQNLNFLADYISKVLVCDFSFQNYKHQSVQQISQTNKYNQPINFIIIINSRSQCQSVQPIS